MVSVQLRLPPQDREAELGCLAHTIPNASGSRLKLLNGLAVQGQIEPLTLDILSHPQA